MSTNSHLGILEPKTFSDLFDEPNIQYRVFENHVQTNWIN
jgi:hypothetical protein